MAVDSCRRGGWGFYLMSVLLPLLTVFAGLLLIYLLLRFQLERHNRALVASLEKNQQEARQNLQQVIAPALLDTEQRLRQELGEGLHRSRGEMAEAFSQLRTEINQSLAAAAGNTTKSAAELHQLVNDRLDRFQRQILDLSEALGKTVRVSMGEMREAIEKSSQASENRLNLLRTTVEQRLEQMQKDNAEKLEQMRATVDDKLQGMLEKRLGESFSAVSERLQKVHEGLGEMQALAQGVGDLKRVMTNVKTRGTWGEVQLGTLLEEMLSPSQFQRDVKIGKGQVEFAIKLPGRGDGADESDVVYLPIDSKFPMEDYQRLMAAQEAADPEAAEAAMKALEQRVKGCARDIRDKYLQPPQTTDFGLMFLPTEGLYAEVIRRTGLAEGLQREFRVVVAGPTTLTALLNSLQMGFRTLAVQKRSSEVWKILGAAKTEYEKFGDLLQQVKKKLDEASNKIDDATRKARTIGSKLRRVDALPEAEARTLLTEASIDDEVEADLNSLLPRARVAREGE